MKNRNLKHSNNWATPKRVIDHLQKLFNITFDFDPCPFCDGDLEFDGLEIEWGKFNFVNPPYSQKLKEAFVNKALEQKEKGKTSVLLLPVSTSTKLFHEVILPNANDIVFIKNRIPFGGMNTRGELVNWAETGLPFPKNNYVLGKKTSGMHDSMVVLFKGIG
jgi:hypothetical protein